MKSYIFIGGEVDKSALESAPPEKATSTDVSLGSDAKLQGDWYEIVLFDFIINPP